MLLQKHQNTFPISPTPLTPIQLTAADDFRDCFRAFRPPPDSRFLTWSIAHAVTDQGRPYDHNAYPHIGAPGGPMDVFDDPWTREIPLQWATRLGKTFFGQVAIEYIADVNPGPMMLCSSSGRLAHEVCQRTYEMIRRTPRVNAKLLKARFLQKKDCIEFTECKVYLAWARSPTTLADKNIRVGIANELDQWEHQTTSKEADPESLFRDRFKDCWSTRKIIFDSVPRLKSKSRIEPRRLAGTNCSYWVPCPHCRRYQVLEFGDGSDHGVRWEKANGKQVPETARSTATYQCRFCSEQIENHHRAWMMRRGVWCPHGAGVNDEIAIEITENMIQTGEPSWEWRGWGSAEWITGQPTQDGIVASYHLTSLYALSLDWGDNAAEFVETFTKPQFLRNWINQWMAETWSGLKQEQTWQQLAERLQSDVPARYVPTPLSMVTMGVDKQIDHYVFTVVAWGPGWQSHTLFYGICGDLKELTELIETKWPHTDGGPTLKAKMTLIDCGFRPAGVYRFCREARKNKLAVFPCRGASRPLNAFYVKSKLGEKSSAPGQPVVRIDSAGTQDWFDHRLHQLRPGQDGSKTLFRSSTGEHQDYLEQLLNDGPIDDLDRHNNVVENWKRIDEDVPNDYRDCERYAFGAMLLATRSAPIRPREPAAEKKDPEQQTSHPTASRPRLHQGPRPRLAP